MLALAPLPPRKALKHNRGLRKGGQDFQRSLVSSAASAAPPRTASSKISAILGRQPASPAIGHIFRTRSGAVRVSWINRQTLEQLVRKPQDFGLTQPFWPLAHEQRVTDLEAPHRRY